MLRYAQKAVRGGKEVCILVLLNQLQKNDPRSRRKSPESNTNITGARYRGGGEDELNFT